MASTIEANTSLSLAATTETIQTYVVGPGKPSGHFNKSVGSSFRAYIGRSLLYMAENNCLLCAGMGFTTKVDVDHV